MSKTVILTGLRANNYLHIGNYLGAILPMVDMAKQKAGEYQVNMFVPDLHSFTTPIDYSTLQAAIMNNLRVYAAAGLPLEHDDVYIYRQSYISAHSELTWILDCFTGMGEMSRMTQFKDKSLKLHDSQQKVWSAEDNEKLSLKKLATSTSFPVTVGLFNYPVLMAADILLYDTTYVPVGDDQTQHLEFARDISERMNSKFGELFVVPKPVKDQHAFFGKDQGLRIKDLQDPSKKMSKSDESGKGVIFLNDSPEVAHKKVMSAVTDDKSSIAYDPEKQPGITNLIDLLALLKQVDKQEVIAKYTGESMYGTFKAEVADTVVEFLNNFQSKISTVNDQELITKLETSETAMRDQANKTLLKVKKAVGLR